MIFLTGDTHGAMDITKLSMKNFPQQADMTKEDYVIILGDFGLVWANSNEEKYWINWLDQKKFTTLFIDGNHENFDLLNSYPIEKWNGGNIHRISDSVIHLMRGQVFNLQDKKFFTFGGAESVDKAYRKEYISWWHQEMPNGVEYEEGLKNLELHNYKVDYILSHDCPITIFDSIKYFFTYINLTTNSLRKYLERIHILTEYKHWFFGHYHKNITFPWGYSLLYDKILDLKEIKNDNKNFTD